MQIRAFEEGDTDEVVALWQEEVGTLVHGDSHLGNLFVDEAAGGRTGFLDWAVVCRAPGIRDVSYTLCNSVPTEVREAYERPLVERYGELLEQAGVTIDPDAGQRQHRIHAV